jgi:hypothetical protein
MCTGMVVRDRAKGSSHQYVDTGGQSMNVARTTPGVGEGQAEGEAVGDGAELVDVLTELRRVAAKLDRLQSQLRGPRMGRLAMRVGEASHGVHRALIALDEPTFFQR